MGRTGTTRGRRQRSARLATLGIVALLAAACGTSDGSPTPVPAVPSPTAGPSSTAVVTPTVAPTTQPSPTPSSRPEPPATSDALLKDVYAAFRPANLRPAAGPPIFTRGSDIVLAYEMVNASSSSVALPVTMAFGRGLAWFGATQSWIERLGKDPSLDACLSDMGRKGSWYAAGGNPGAFGYAPSRVEVGQGMTMRAVLSAGLSACLPPGRYRYHLEYKPFEQTGLDDVIATVALDFEIRATDAWSVALREATASGRATVRIPTGTAKATTTLDLATVAPATKVRAEIRFGACDPRGTLSGPIVAATASTDGTVHARATFDVSRSTRRALAGGRRLSLFLTLGSGMTCMPFTAVPYAGPATRAPTTWGSALLREDLGAGVAVAASSQTFGGQAAQAIDRNVDLTWNAGGYAPAWIELDLGRNRRVDGIRLLPSQLPNVAETIHRVFGRVDGSVTEVLLATLSGTTQDNVWIEARFKAPATVRYLRVATTASPSWVSWREIALLGTTLPPPNALPLGTHDGTQSSVAAGHGCYANGWASDPNDRSRTASVRVLVDGVEVWRGPADLSRLDVAAAGVGDETSGFWVDLWALISHGASHEIRVQALDEETGSWVDLGATPRPLTCS